MLLVLVFFSLLFNGNQPQPLLTVVNICNCSQKAKVKILISSILLLLVFAIIFVQNRSNKILADLVTQSKCSERKQEWEMTAERSERAEKGSEQINTLCFHPNKMKTKLGKGYHHCKQKKSLVLISDMEHTNTLTNTQLQSKVTLIVLPHPPCVNSLLSIHYSNQPLVLTSSSSCCCRCVCCNDVVPRCRRAHNVYNIVGAKHFLFGENL